MSFTQGTISPDIEDVGIVIPRPHVQIQPKNAVKNDVSVPLTVLISWLANDQRFLDHNPQIWLYRYNRARKKGSPGNRVVRRAWTHPSDTDLGPTNDKWWGGYHYDAGGNPMIPRVTEVDITTTEGQVQTFPLLPEAWFRNIGGGIPQIGVDGFYDIQPTGKRRKSTFNTAWPDPTQIRRIRDLRQWFRFAIVIDDPRGVTTGSHGKIFGPMSETISMFPSANSLDGLLAGFWLGFGSEHRRSGGL
jgi:hypothetical protein